MGCIYTNDKGRIIEYFITEHNLVLLNDKSSPYLHPATGSYSSLDLTICSPGIFPEFTNPANYRSIALTSCICKTMERMVNDRLVWFLEKNKLIATVQSGFRKQRGTLDHLVRFETFIREVFIKKEHVVSVFFDLESAYYTT